MEIFKWAKANFTPSKPNFTARVGPGVATLLVGTLHCALENGADLYVNKRQKIREYRSRSTEEEEERKNAK